MHSEMRAFKILHMALAIKEISLTTRWTLLWDKIDLLLEKRARGRVLYYKEGLELSARHGHLCI
jgi:hypothetical protein